MFWQGGGKKRMQEMIESRLQNITQPTELTANKVARTDEDLLYLYYHRGQLKQLEKKPIIKVQSTLSQAIGYSRNDSTIEQRYPQKEEGNSLKQSQCASQSKSRICFPIKMDIHRRLSAEQFSLRDPILEKQIQLISSKQSENKLKDLS